MVRSLLTVDWDYFIPSKKEWFFSYIENDKNLTQLWYKRYIKGKLEGEDLEKTIKVGKVIKGFWDKIKTQFKFDKNIKIFVSESHKVAYYLAKNFECSEVVSFDAHSDLGYGGLPSLDFELNCANWLGKLLKENIVKRAKIVYSPYTFEKPLDFEDFNNLYNIQYYKSVEELPKENLIGVIHICRSGTWTPPWLDERFEKFINELGLPFKKIAIKERKWEVSKLSYADQIFYLNFA
ncbi:arginase [Thermoanaerobacter brockii subsp. lactiethylicus]|uniref:Arginase n=2 Tax=Thermoanaerobacter TaxID=1754 RepID=B0K9K3_THEP3|nr:MULTISPECIES: hypothetical protein [Thermoanaerobacter]ABY92886.1 hypothetical protein Teth514_1599 [Thermoanaerobacter sp. X514]ABY94816.1 hypothetical protein Teth39_1162 [Thermoanaerobacter pseudethanolicus ATCC 33223]ADV79765.1 hypothetical protein Thebr_1191 [Thermoanaerobacter brockii subsp. finnii Ako-1]HBW58794.1 arginase [Thermoanaerobacter sp.]